MNETLPRNFRMKELRETEWLHRYIFAILLWKVMITNLFRIRQSKATLLSPDQAKMHCWPFPMITRKVGFHAVPSWLILSSVPDHWSLSSVQMPFKPDFQLVLQMMKIWKCPMSKKLTLLVKNGMAQAWQDILSQTD